MNVGHGAFGKLRWVLMFGAPDGTTRPTRHSHNGRPVTIFNCITGLSCHSTKKGLFLNNYNSFFRHHSTSLHTLQSFANRLTSTRNDASWQVFLAHDKPRRILCTALNPLSRLHIGATHRQPSFNRPILKIPHRTFIFFDCYHLVTFYI